MTIFRGIDTVGTGGAMVTADELFAAEAAAAASAAAALVSEGLADADATATAADVVLTNSDVVLTNADVVLTNADAVLTSADVVLTGLDVVSTNADVITTAASAAAALVSENAAAASAATIPTYDTITGEALNFVRLNAGETSMEFRTPAEVLADISAEPADATIVKDADIGVTVQAFDDGLAYLDGLNFTNESTFKAGVNLEPGTDVQAFNSSIPTVVMSQAEAEAGTSTANRTVTAERIKQAIDALATSSAVSSAFTLTSGGLITWAHGLGAKPTIINGYLKCLTAEDNWSIGDEVEAQFYNNSNASTSRFNSVRTDATNVYMRLSSSTNCFGNGNKTSGANATAANARWELYLRAFL